MANATELPNAFTPLAFLPPTLAAQFEVSRYLYAATLGAYIWDIALNLGNDSALLFKHRFRFPTALYFLSRDPSALWGDPVGSDAARESRGKEGIGQGHGV
ncbi:hypothetical protein B0H16DRAFT_1469986 [Mycena metata]|uniref:Uncharacterized protein n=1 Tax=Mycena metata TaxID=1033252 RepID=A0AAD7HWA4_9AGAR|nr:hypothetical protein B0H16DRAFT_1476655 [Mycena metata]KAJ7729602.1 hypothetical protein B0H16DRAFT_1469986 [Mycena metata]